MDTGTYYRSGTYNNKGINTGLNAFRASFPHLIDVGIMGHCIHGSSGLCVKAGVECYQNGLGIREPNMTLEDFKRIVDACKGKLFQFALGGRGDPDQHEHFEEILRLSRENDIVPNLTSSGLGFTDRIVSLIKAYCGAAAVSWYRSDYTLTALEQLIEAGVKTNIHFVLANNSIDEAYDMMLNRSYPEGVNRIIFLLHKPVGLGTRENVLRTDDPRVERFFSLFNRPPYNEIAGFDSCSIPALLNYAPGIFLPTVDTCEGARFSAYITPDMQMLPCSFDQEKKWAVDLNTHTLEEAWESPAFEDFRSRLSSSCPACPKRRECYGGCPITSEIVLCDRKEVPYESQA